MNFVEKKRKTRLIFVAILVWVLFVFVPYIFNYDKLFANSIFLISLLYFFNRLVFILTFYFNYSYLIPKFLIKNKIKIYFLLFTFFLFLVPFFCFLVRKIAVESLGGNLPDVAVINASKYIPLVFVLQVTGLGLWYFKSIKNQVVKVSLAPTVQSETNEISLNYFFIKSEYKTVKILFNEVQYISGLKDYVKIFCIDQKRPILTRMNLKNMEKLLPREKFVRVHRSFIVNLSKIESTKKSSLILGGKEIPLGSSYYQNYISRLKK